MFACQSKRGFIVEEFALLSVATGAVAAADADADAAAVVAGIAAAAAGAAADSNAAPVVVYQTVSVEAIPDGWMGLDNGPESTKLIQVKRFSENSDWSSAPLLPRMVRGNAAD